MPARCTVGRIHFSHFPAPLNKSFIFSYSFDCQESLTPIKDDFVIYGASDAQRLHKAKKPNLFRCKLTLVFLTSCVFLVERLSEDLM